MMMTGGEQPIDEFYGDVLGVIEVLLVLLAIGVVVTREYF